jgi:hypothetical protein
MESTVSWAQIAPEVVGSFVGSVVGVMGAWLVARWSFNKGVAEERDARREEARQARNRVLAAVRSELLLSIVAISEMREFPNIHFSLRRDALDQYFGILDSVPSSGSNPVLEASLHIDRYNATVERIPLREQVAVDPREKLGDAATAITSYLSGEPNSASRGDG